jgi:general secretion pathway protein L
MAGLRARLGKAGLTGLVPDYLTLPSGDGVWILQADGGRIVARLGAEDGFAAETALALAQLDLALIDRPPRAVLRLGGADAALDDWLAGLELPVRTDLQKLKPQPQIGTAGVDFLADPQVALDRAARRLAGWLRIAAVLLIAVGCAGAALVLETRAARAVATLARTEAEALARRTLLPTGPILDLRAQLTRRIAEIAPGGDAPASVAALMRQAAAPLAGTDPKSLIYRPPGRLAVELDLADFAAVDALTDTLRTAGLDVIVASAGADAARGVVRAVFDLGVSP